MKLAGFKDAASEVGDGERVVAAIEEVAERGGTCPWEHDTRPVVARSTKLSLRRENDFIVGLPASNASCPETESFLTRKS